MKGIILAGGKGTRVYPMTLGVAKALLPIYDKPLIYYSLSTLIENGVDDICIISSPDHLPSFKKTLGNGSRFGINLIYKEQAEPKGIADAFTIAKSFIKRNDVALLLGDNLFYGSSVFSRAFKNFSSGGSIFAYEVNDPERYGVIELSKSGVPLSLKEKPQEPKTNLAIPGLYIFDESVVKVAERLKPSARGELEITDVIQHYLDKKNLKVHKINRGCAWLDAGTCQSMNEAGEYVRVIEQRQGVKIGCPEEAALKCGFLSKESLRKEISKMPDVEYKSYLKILIK
jgi:glucose-1-phosphate thymidylyltransferase